MTAVTAPIASSAFHTADPGQLDRIRERAVNLCVWQRSVEPEMVRFIDRVVLPLSIRREVTATPEDLNLDQLLCDIPAEHGFTLFGTDIETLAHLYVKLTGIQRITLKIESFACTLCERFHTDRVQLRMICSYAGPGTQWLANEDVDRHKLGPGAGGLPDESSGLIRSGAAIGALDRFAVGLMKGDDWPGNRNLGLVHRSPRTSARRILLKIEDARV